jgi:hypothetical protein
MLIVVLLVVLFAICASQQRFAIAFNGKPQRVQLLISRAILNLISNGIAPLLQLAITDELAAFVLPMDKYYIRPGFDAHDQVFGNFQQLRDASDTNAEFLSRLKATK